MTPAPQAQEWIISDKDYHIALEYFHLEARPYTSAPCSQSYSNCPIKISEAAIRNATLDEFMNLLVSSRFELDGEIVVKISSIRNIRESLRGDP